MNTLQAPTLQAVVLAHTEDMRQRTGVKQLKWAERVDAAYCRLVAPEHRTLPAPDLSQVTDGDSYSKMRTSWAQQVRRYESGELNFPLELLEAWVDAMDDAWKDKCDREIAIRRGLAGVKRYEASGEGDHKVWGEALQEFGAVTMHMGKILANGQIDKGDAPEIPDTIAEIRAAVSHLMGLERQLLRVAEEKDEKRAGLRSVS